jgi:CoA:oxalate CoA-transferase
VPGPLQGVRILDFTTLTAGAAATGWLCDLGADVIKVEPPGGEVGRRLSAQPSGLSAFFLPQNRGKRSVVLNLQTAWGREAALTLARNADAVTHNFRPGVMERLGLGYEDVRRVNAEVVYGEMSGFGTEGPDASLGAVDIVGQARSGLMSVTGEERPLPAGAILSDYTAAMHLAIGVLSALFWRERSGRGQRVSGSMLGSMINAQAWELTTYLVSRRQPFRGGRGHHLFAAGVWGVYDTADGHVVISSISSQALTGLALAFDRPELASDRFADPATRGRHIEELRRLLRRAFAGRSTEAVYATLRSLDVVCSPVQSYEAVERDPQVVANDYIVEVDHPRAGRLKMTGNPLRFSETPLALAAAEPLAGEHTDAVLAEAGIAREDAGAAVRRDGGRRERR